MNKYEIVITDEKSLIRLNTYITHSLPFTCAFTTLCDSYPLPLVQYKSWLQELRNLLDLLTQLPYPKTRSI